MGVKITSRKYNNQFYTPSQDTDWLLGNVGDWQRLEVEIEVKIEFLATTQESVGLSITEKTFVLNNGKRWSDYGFDIGDTVSFTYKRDIIDGNGDTVTSSHSATLNVVNLYDDTLEHDSTFTAEHIQSVSIMPTDRGNEKFYDVKFFSIKESEGLKFRYTHLSNEDYESEAMQSFIDGTVTEFSYAGINSLTSKQDMNPDGLQSGMSIKNATVEKLSYANGVGNYRITCDFMISSFFEDVSNFENRIAPSVLFNAGSLTDNFEIEVFPEWNNPNTSIKNDLNHTERLGNTGWFDENFNGLDNNFKLEYVKYTDENGLVIDQLDYSKKVNVEVLVSGIDNLSLNSEFTLGFAWIPQNEEDYKNKQTPFHENLFVNTGRSYTDGSNDSFNLSEQTNTTVFEGFGINGAKMNMMSKGDIPFNAGGTDKVLIKASFEPNTEFFNLFNQKDDNDRKYILWVSLANHNLAINFSDRVSLLVDYRDMVKIIPLAGEYEEMTNRFLEHPQNQNDLGKTKYFGFIEDDVLSKVNFTIDKSKDILINSMSFGYEVVNQDTLKPYILEEYSENLTQFPKDSNGVQQINIYKVRGFKTAVGNKNNFVKIKRNTSLDSFNNIGYQVKFASKLRWEDWLERQEVPDEYFNIDLEHNGKHNNWLDYLRNEPLGNYKVNFFVFLDVVENGELVRYKNSYNVDFRGYDENLNIETTHQYFNNEDDTLLNIGVDPDTNKPLGVILNDTKTRIEITFENKTNDFDFDSIYGIIGIELYKGPGEFEFRQLSSVWESEGDNPLEPLGEETLLSLEQISNRIVKLKCIVNPVLLEEYYKYKITGRIGCFDKGITQSQDGLYENKYEDKYQ